MPRLSGDASISIGDMVRMLGAPESAKREHDPVSFDLVRRFAGTTVFLQGDAPDGFFVVRSGCVKVYVMEANGRQAVVAFAGPGGLVGFEGIASRRHTCSAVCLEDTELVWVPASALRSSGPGANLLQAALVEALARELMREQQRRCAVSAIGAEVRVGRFLGAMAEEVSRTTLRLPMSRREIGEFLGLTAESVSRAFSVLAREHGVQVRGRDVVLPDVQRAATLARPEPPARRASQRSRPARMT